MVDFFFFRKLKTNIPWQFFLLCPKLFLFSFRFLGRALLVLSSVSLDPMPQAPIRTTFSAPSSPMTRRNFEAHFYGRPLNLHSWLIRSIFKGFSFCLLLWLFCLWNNYLLSRQDDSSLPSLDFRFRCWLKVSRICTVPYSYDTMYY